MRLLQRLVLTAMVFLLLGPALGAVDLEGGIFSNNTTLQIKLKATGGSFNSSISAVQFAIKYLTSYGVSFSAPSTPAGIGLSLQTTQSSGNYTYQFYSWTGSTTPNWTQNSETIIVEVTVSGGTGLGTFELVNSEGLVGGNDPNYYVESASGLPGGATSTLYHASASNVPLPVELIGFSARTFSDRIRLEWETASELNSSGYEVERAAGTADWSRIGFVRGSGSVDYPVQYHFDDVEPFSATMPFPSNTLRYRLRQVDRDGSIEYSPIVSVQIGATLASGVHHTYPNPASTGENVFVSFTLDAESVAHLTVFDMFGRPVRSIVEETLQTGSHTRVMGTQGLPPGTYMVQLRTDACSSTRAVQLR